MNAFKRLHLDVSLLSLTALSVTTMVALVLVFPHTISAQAPKHAQDYPYAGAHKGSCSNGFACVIDPWRFYERECTSYVAWRLNKEYDLLGIGFEFSNDLDNYGGVDLGSAITWADAAANLGYKVNKQPKVGAVAWWGHAPSGHVAYVESVNQDGSVNVSEYLSHLNGVYNYRERVKAEKYIHFKSHIIERKYQDKELEILSADDQLQQTILVEDNQLMMGTFSLRTKNGELLIELEKQPLIDFNNLGSLLAGASANDSTSEAGNVLGISSDSTAKPPVSRPAQIVHRQNYIPRQHNNWIWADITAAPGRELVNLRLAGSNLHVDILQLERNHQVGRYEYRKRNLALDFKKVPGDMDLAKIDLGNLQIRQATANSNADSKTTGRDKILLHTKNEQQALLSVTNGALQLKRLININL